MSFKRIENKLTLVKLKAMDNKTLFGVINLKYGVKI